jgi:beta-glucanase (GH16 family)
MLGSNIDKVGWPKCEIDILEYVGREPDIFYFFTQDSHGNTINTKKTRIEDIEEGYHIYAMDWSKDKIDFLLIII